MLEVYAFATPNSIRVPIALEELGLEYTLRSVNVRKGEQKDPAFRKINPNAKVPVLVDPHGPSGDPIVLTESAAILATLQRKPKNCFRFMAPSVRESSNNCSFM